MSNKSGVSRQVISLPTGGGALQGIGETFAPDLFTGTGNFTVPIALPPGRNGFQPALNLVYSTGHGNGPFGLGWHLSIPGVSRKTAKGVPRYRDDAAEPEQRNTFILSGAEDLVPVEVLGATTRYRPRTEGLFARISRHRDADNDYWEVQSKDGLVSRYGTVGMAGADPAVIADPAQRDKVFAWQLTRTVDTFGNRIEYAYERDHRQTVERHWDQLYLQHIRYVEYEDASQQELFLVTVTFTYHPADEPPNDGGQERADAFSDHRAGFEIRTRKRCRSIVVHTQSDTVRRVRTYALTYLDERGGEAPPPMRYPS